MRISCLPIILIGMNFASSLRGEWSLDMLDEAMSYSSPSQNVRADLSVLADLEWFVPRFLPLGSCSQMISPG